jgi:hypothetical protein
MSPSNLEILAYEHTALGPLCLRRRELLSSPGTVVTEVTLDHEFLMSSLYTDSEEALARVALEMHPGSDWMEADLLPLSPVLEENERFEVETADAYARLVGPPSHLYDVILVDIDHAPQDRLGGADDAFYTVEGLRRVRLHLTPGGVLGVWSWAESWPFARAMQEVFESVRVEPVTYINHHVDEERTDWLFFGTTSDSADPPGDEGGAAPRAG